MRPLIVCIAIGFLVSVCAGNAMSPYLSQEPPGMKPEIFAPGIVCLPNRCEVGGFFSPDMNEFFFTETDGRWSWAKNLMTTIQDGLWSVPDYVPYDFVNDSLCRFLPGDAQTLYFFRWSPGTNSDVWYSRRTTSGWGPSERLPEPINSSAAEWGFTRANDGTLYISSTRSGNADIYRIQVENGQYGPAEPLSVNSPHQENGPHVSPDHKYLMFHSNRPGGYGKNDLYISIRQENNSWSEPINMGPTINTEIEQWDPKISPDGKYLFYIHRSGWSTNNETSDIHWVDIRAVLPDPNGPIENLSSGMRFSSIQCAVNYAKPGDTIFIEPGIYTENIILDKDLTLQSVEPTNPYFIGGTIIQGNTLEPVLTLNGNTEACEIAGLTLRVGSVGVFGNATNAMLHHCRLMDNVTHGVELTAASPTLQHCLITSNGQTGITMHKEGRNDCQPVIESCIIAHNGGESLVGGNPVIVNSIIQEY